MQFCDLELNDVLILSVLSLMEQMFVVEFMTCRVTVVYQIGYGTAYGCAVTQLAVVMTLILQQSSHTIQWLKSAGI
jgi:hypothetical protein